MGAWFSNLSGLTWLLLALPLLLVHLLKFKPRKLIVPSTRLWREAIEEPVANRFLSSIKRWREFLLQLLVLVLVVLALAGLQIPDFGEPPARRIFFLDARASMLANHQGKTRLELAREFIRQEAEAASPNDTFGLMLIGQEAKVLLDPGSAPTEVLRVLDDLELPKGGCTDAEFANSLGQGLKAVIEGETPMMLTGPSSREDRFPSSIGVETFGEPIENQGITALYLSSPREDDLSISLGVLQKEGERLVLMLERQTSAEGEDETWEVLSSTFAENSSASFRLGSREIESAARYRIRLEQGDAFMADNQVHFRWQLLPNLTLRVEDAKVKEAIEAFSVLGAPRVESQGEIIVHGDEKDKDAEGLSGELLRMPSPWWNDIPHERVDLESIYALDPKTNDEVMLSLASQPVALLRRRGASKDLILSRSLLQSVAFQTSYEFLTLIGEWYRDRRRAALGEEERGIEASAVLDYGLSSRVGFERIIKREARKKKVEEATTHPLSLAIWLLWAALGILALEWLLYLRSRREKT